MEYLVLATSLRTDSHSRILARHVTEAYAQRGGQVAFVDLRDHPLPLCDGGPAYDDPGVAALSALIAKARVVTLAVPIYNYDVNAATKNLVELTGPAWAGRIVAFLCAAGGQRSYMSMLGLANSLMLDFRAVIVPRFVYATKADFRDGQLVSPEIAARVGELAETSMRLRYV